MIRDFLLNVLALAVIANVVLLPFVGRSKFLAKLWGWNFFAGVLIVAYLLT